MNRTYAKARLRLGMSGVGFWVIVACAILFFDGSRVLPDADSSMGLQALALFTLVLGYAALCLPFDVMGGYLLPKRFGRSAASFPGFLRAWTRGMTTKGLVFFAAGLLLIFGGRTLGSPGAVVVMILSSLLLLTLQGRLASAVGGIRRSRKLASSIKDRLVAPSEQWKAPVPRFVLMDSKDVGFTGGIVGWPGRETAMLPSSWIGELPPAGLSAQLVRLQGIMASGSRTQGIVFALIWNLLGFVLALQLPGAGAQSVRELAVTSSGVTLWSFLGLLVLPSVSRLAVRSADACAIQNGVPRDLLDNTMERLDKRQDDEPVRSRWVERIFHPIPSLYVRQKALDNGDPPTWRGAWHVARLTLFLSWASLGLLSQAVHCNSGRPELWVLLPTE